MSALVNRDDTLRTPIGSVVRAWREARGWTGTELAARAGRPITKGYLSQLERDKIHNPGDDKLAQLADALEISVWDLITRRMPNEGFGVQTSLRPRPLGDGRESDQTPDEPNEGERQALQWDRFSPVKQSVAEQRRSAGHEALEAEEDTFLAELLNTSASEAGKEPDIILNEVKDLLDTAWESDTLSARDRALIGSFIRAGLQWLQRREEQ